MKTLTIIITLLLWQLPQDSTIKQIKENYSKIKSSLQQFTKETKDLMDMSTEGGSATFYRDKSGKIQLVTTELYFESGKLIEEYYFKNDSLFFVYSEDHTYNVPFYVDSTFVKENGGEMFDPKKTNVEQQRYYFSNNKLIQWLGPKSKAAQKDSIYFKKELEILEFCKMLLK